MATGNLPSVSDWFDQLCRSINVQGLLSPHGDPLPQYPVNELQVRTTGRGGVDTLLPAAGFYADIVATAERIGSPLRPDSRIVDFGSGWGRITRFFLRDTRLENISGLDVDPYFVDVSNRTFGRPLFQVCTPLPRTSLATGSVDLVTAFSVLSHLSEETSRQWVDEFARVLKPGGLFVFTTRNEWFLDLCIHLGKLTDLSRHQQVLTRIFSDWEDARRRFRAGEFLYSPTGGGGVRDSSFYGESFIPRSYVEKHYGRDFELVYSSDDTQPRPSEQLLPGKAIPYEQACFILRRR